MHVDRPTPQPLEVRLGGTSPLHGVVHCGNQEPKPFEGWVALAAAVESCVAEEARRSAEGRFAEAVDR